MSPWQVVGDFELHTFDGDVKVPKGYEPLKVKVGDYELKSPIRGKIEKLSEDDYYSFVWVPKKESEDLVIGSGTCLEDALEVFINSLILDYEMAEYKPGKDYATSVIRDSIYNVELGAWF
jgi:hypothetical protein